MSDKPKRVMSEKQKANLQKGREALKKKQNGEPPKHVKIVTDTEKERNNKENSIKPVTVQKAKNLGIEKTIKKPRNIKAERVETPLSKTSRMANAKSAAFLKQCREKDKFDGRNNQKKTTIVKSVRVPHRVLEIDISSDSE